MREIIMVRYGEIYLKGQNRPYFQKLLLERVKDAVKQYRARVCLHDSRLIVSDYSSAEGCIQRLVKVFGVHSLCVATEMEKDDFELLCAQAVQLMEGLEGTFKVVARRADKNYPLDSPDICAKMGGYILEHCPKLSVDVREPQHIMNVEIRDQAFLYVKVVQGAGGMPVGSNGKAVLLLSGGIDSPVAGHMIAKRGVEISAVHFFSYPYTGERAKEKVIELARLLSESCCGIDLHIVPFTEIQMKIHELCPDDHTTLIMRRFMMRIAERVAEMTGAQALITGEAIGQVASQTMQALSCTDMVVDRPIFRPLIGFDKVDVIEYARKIGTYETSCLPYEDCCTVFTPKHPVTHPKPDRVERAERALEIETLIETAVAGIETIHISGMQGMNQA